MANILQSKTAQIVLGIIAFVVIFFVLIPLLPAVFYIRTIVQVVLVLVAIWWVLSLVGISIP